MIDIQDKHQCCGCEACLQACPKHCIAFQEDSEGFAYPSVDKSICIDCGLCENVCPVLHQSEPNEPLKVYAAQNTNEKELLTSSSGGLFILLAKEILSQGGVVFGAKFDEHWNVIHSYAETEEGAKVFMGSKYVQSRIGNMYIKAKDFLDSGKKVLFTGTPCQISGLKNYLRKDYENLLTVDVICHGVPSPMVWRRYLDELIKNTDNALSANSNVQIKSISFRDKRSGWKKYSIALTLVKAQSNGKKNIVSLSHIFQEDPYMTLFLCNYTLRPSCYICPAKAGKSNSDLTIADFWGIERSYPDLDDNRGVGLLLVNSNKGTQAFSSLALSSHEASYTDAIMSNSSYMNSVVEPSSRDQCFKLIKSSNKSFQEIVEKLQSPPLSIRAKVVIYRFLKKIIGVI